MSLRPLFVLAGAFFVLGHNSLYINSICQVKKPESRAGFVNKLKAVRQESVFLMPWKSG
jgi:hypothetical protein